MKQLETFNKRKADIASGAATEKTKKKKKHHEELEDIATDAFVEPEHVAEAEPITTH